MTEITMDDSPLAIFPERDFESFHGNLTDRLGRELPIEIALAEMADQKSPDSKSTILLNLEEPDYGTLSFRKIFSNGTCVGIALLPSGKLSDPHVPLPERIVQGSIVKAARLLPAKWPKENETAKKYNLENLLYRDNNYDKANLAFLSVLDGVFSQLKTHNPSEYSKLFGKNELVIADIGCGWMPYGDMLALYFLNLRKTVKILGIDPYSKIDTLESRREQTKRIIPEAEIDFIPIPYSLEESEPHLKGAGIKSIDLITMFNQQRPGIDIGELPTYLRESALVLMALDDDYDVYRAVMGGRGAKREDVIQSLSRRGYMVILENRNPYSPLMAKGLPYKYNPVLIAQRVGELLRK